MNQAGQLDCCLFEWLVSVPRLYSKERVLNSQLVGGLSTGPEGLRIVLVSRLLASKGRLPMRE